MHGLVFLMLQFLLFCPHYENMPRDSFSCKNENFNGGNIDSCNMFAQNIDYRYTLEPPS